MVLEKGGEWHENESYERLNKWYDELFVELNWITIVIRLSYCSPTLNRLG